MTDMMCPRCERGTIKKVTLKLHNDAAYVCEYCEMVWLNDEEIQIHSGHPIRVLTQGEALEYTFENTEESDQDHTSVLYPGFK